MAPKTSAKKSAAMSTTTVDAPLPIEKKVVSASVPASRVSTQIKTYISTNGTNLLNEFKKNPSYDNFIKEFTDITENIKKFAKKPKDGTRDEDALKDAREKLKTLKTEHKTIAFEYKEILKRNYRTGGSLTKAITFLINKIINSLLLHCIKTTTDSGKKQVQIESLANVDAFNNDCFPLFNSLDTFRQIVNNELTAEIKQQFKTPKKPSKKEKVGAPADATTNSESAGADESQEDESVEADKKKTLKEKKEKNINDNYKTTVQNIYKNLIAKQAEGQTKGLTCATDTKGLISKLIVEFIDKIIVNVDIIVGSTNKVGTINSSHIIETVKLLYFNIYNNFDKFNILKAELLEYLRVSEEEDKKKKETSTTAVTPAVTTKPAPKKPSTKKAAK